MNNGGGQPETPFMKFTTTNVFEKVLTSPAIIIIDRSTRTEQIVYDKHLIRLPDGSISGITPLGKYMRKTLQLYLKRHEIIHNLDKLKRKRDELKNSVAKDKLQGKECRKKEAALQLITESFFEYFNLWEKISQESA